MKLHRDLNVTQKTAWFMLHRIREAWGSVKDTMAGPVEVDETYMGGKRRNMSNAKRRELAEAGAGRGTVGKTIIAGVKDRTSKKVRAQVITDTGAPTLQGFVRDNAEPGATVYTDEHGSYASLGADYEHATVNHSVGEYVREMAHTNGIESFWSMLKRGYVGVYHKLSPKHLDRYVREYAGRHNVRDLKTLDQMGAVVIGMVGRRLMYKELIADNGLYSGARA